jgi:CBS domain containing-hemolysin-like protein
MLGLMLLIVAIFLCLALSFFFSGSETAVISVNRYRLRSLHEQGDPRAGRLLALLDNTQRLLIMALIGANLANVLAALLFKMLLEMGIAGTNERALGLIRWSELLSLLLLTPVLIIFAEILPKALFRAHADRLARTLRPVYVACLWLLHPAIWVMERIARLMLGTLAEARSQAMRRLTRQDVIQLLKPEERPAESTAGGGSGETPLATAAREAMPAGLKERKERAPEESGERRMVENILKLNQTMAEEIMTPLVDLVAVQLGQIDLDALRQMAIGSGYSRFPVYRERIVHIVGFIDIYRVLREDDGSQTILDFIERPHYVPETKRVDDLLQEFLRLRIKNAVVVDEYGGCSGWISREDIIEEIVGELQDELDEPLAPVQRTAEDVYQADGRVEIDVLNGALGTAFPEANWETLAGLVLNEMGRLPREGDEVTIDGWRAKVLAMDRLRIATVELRRQDAAT